MWEEYFKIYPFSEDRADSRAALISQTVANMSGQKLKVLLDLSTFLPKYLDEVSPVEKSLARQKVEALAFREKLLEMQAMAGQ